MPIGNDVVDLRDSETATSALHSRFDQRVFDPAERALVAQSEDPHRLRWTLWAAKESCFKLHTQLDPAVYFSPAAFRITHLTANRAEVIHRGHRFAVALRSTADWVHAVAACRDPERGLAALAQRAGDASAQVRQLATRATADLLGLAADTVTIASRCRIPRAIQGGRELAASLSLSHHGRFVACAVLPD